MVCHLLEKLPAELRNAIYQLAFTGEVNITVDLREAKPPDKALTLVCRQKYRESRGIYKHAYCKYWRTTHFTTAAPSAMPYTVEQRWRRESRLGSIKDIKERDLQQMVHFTMTAAVDEGEFTYALLDPRGGWIETSKQRNRKRLVRLTAGSGLVGLMQGDLRLKIKSSEVADETEATAKFDDEFGEIETVLLLKTQIAILLA